jgi:hypothetical protein
MINQIIPANPGFYIEQDVDGVTTRAPVIAWLFETGVRHALRPAPLTPAGIPVGNNYAVIGPDGEEVYAG